MRACPEAKARALPWLARAIERAGPFGGADGPEPPATATTAPSLSPNAPAQAIEAGAGTEGNGNGPRGASAAQKRRKALRVSRGSGEAAGECDGGRSWPELPVEGRKDGGGDGGRDVVAERGLCRLVQAASAAPSSLEGSAM